MRILWTESEIEDLKRLYPHNLSSRVAEILNRKLLSVYAKAASLGLKKSEDYIKSHNPGRLTRDNCSVGVQYRFQKGHIPYNKGKKMTSDVYDRIKHTFFQKGHKPVNLKYDGHERISVDGYVEIRITKNKYVLKHRLVYETSFGPIPEGYLVVFKDGNHLNIIPENLELITRKENMARNTIARYPAELKSAIRLNAKLKKIINEKQN